MFMTPAMASEPYCAAAPSRSTSTRSIASTGMVLRSVPVLPRLRAPNRLTSEVVWRRLPLISTRVWSDPRLRSAAPSTRSAPSAPVWRVEKNEGTVNCSDCARSNCAPRSATSCIVMTSTGTGDSVSDRPMRREPSTVIWSSTLASSAAGSASSCANTAGAATERLIEAAARASHRRERCIVVTPRERKERVDYALTFR
jgi:hypothetical protein